MLIVAHLYWLQGAFLAYENNYFFDLQDHRGLVKSKCPLWVGHPVCLSHVVLVTEIVGVGWLIIPFFYCLNSNLLHNWP